MTRAILLITAVALLGGCGDCDDPSSMTFYWRFVSSSDTVAGTFDIDDPSTPADETGCSVAGVDEVRIHVAGTTEVVSCVGPNGVPGARLPGFARGTFDWTVEGVRSGIVAFTQSGTARTGSCSDTPVFADLRAVSPGDLVVFYDFNGQLPAACASGGAIVSDIAYELRDATNRTAATTCQAANAAGQCTGGHADNPCDPASFGFIVPDLPHGSYTLAYVQALNPAGGVVLQACQAAVPHDGFPVFVNLTAAACTFPPPVAVTGVR